MDELTAVIEEAISEHFWKHMPAGGTSFRCECGDVVVFGQQTVGSLYSSPAQAMSRHSAEKIAQRLVERGW